MSCDGNRLELVKYLSQTVSVLMTRNSSSITDAWETYLPDSLPTHEEVITECEQERAVTATVGRYTGVVTLTDCVETLTGDAEDGPDAWGEILCGDISDTRVPWMDLWSKLGACNGYIRATPECAADLVFPGQRTPEQVIADYEGLNVDEWVDDVRLCEDGLGGDTGTARTHHIVTNTCQVELTPTSIEFHLTQYQFDEVWGFMVYPNSKWACTKPTHSVVESTNTVDVLITLGTPYSSADLNADVDGLLGQLALTDNSQVWHHTCIYPRYSYREVQHAVEPGTFTMGDCAYVDANAATFDGALITDTAGGTFDGAFKYFANGLMLAGKYAEILSPRPGHNFYRPCGADRNLLANFNLNIRRTYAAGGGEVVLVCYVGAFTHAVGDRTYVRDLTVNTQLNTKHWPITAVNVTTDGGEDVIELTLGNTVSLGDEPTLVPGYPGYPKAGLVRFPTAWPICVELTVSGATNATPIVITTGTNFLLSFDKVVIAGVVGNTAANGTHYVKWLTDTTFELYTDITLAPASAVAGNGLYTSGGTVRNTAQTLPGPVTLDVPADSVYADASRGDFVVVFWQYENRAAAEDLNLRKYNNVCGSYSRPVAHLGGPSGVDTIAQGNITGNIVCISPSGESFGAGNVTYAFPTFAMPLVCDWLYGSQWVGQVHQRMDNPINQTGLESLVETRIAPPATQPSIPEARGGVLDAIPPYGISGIEMLSLARVTALLDAAMPGVGGSPPCPVFTSGTAPNLPQKLAPGPYVACIAFDDDSGSH